MISPRCYAERRINPFLGVVQVIESDLGRALSTDGSNWEIQLYAERSFGWGSLGVSRQTSLYRYGVWSEQEGQACFPAPPQVDRELALSAARALIEAAQAAKAALPFPLRDGYERWLLDANANRRPIALLEAVNGGEPLATSRAARWSCATGEGLALDAAVRSALEAQVRLRAGQAMRTQWFRREADGSGMAMAVTANMPGQLTQSFGGYFLEADEFPELLLQEEWEDAGERERVALYVRTLAPRLLMLPLRHETRARLERVAATQALAVDRFHRLYPEVMDPALLLRLRVEAQLRRSREDRP